MHLVHKFKHDKVIFVGDIHGDFSALTSIVSQYDNALIYQVGDFGAGFWHADKFSDKLLAVANTARIHNNHVVAIRGNHDDPHYFSNLVYHEHITLLRDYSVVEVAGHRILGFGGAISIDRQIRQQGKDYWNGEPIEFDWDAINNARDINIVVTHSAPETFVPYGINDFVRAWCKNDPTLQEQLIFERKSLQSAYNVLTANNKIDHWLYGHFHQSHVDYDGATSRRLIDINQTWSPDYQYAGQVVAQQPIADEDIELVDVPGIGQIKRYVKR